MFLWETVKELLEADDTDARARLLDSIRQSLDQEELSASHRCSALAGAIENVLRDRRAEIERAISR